MKTTHLILVGVLVGAISLAPTNVPLAHAVTKAKATSAGSNVTTKQYGAVAGSSSAATTTAAYSLPTLTASCSVSNDTENKKTKSGAATIKMASVAGFDVGMEMSGVEFAAGTLITSIDGGGKSITISIDTIADIDKNTAIVAEGCWQRYFSVNNIQNTALASFGIQQTFSTPGETVTMQRCSGTWTESTGDCSGTISTIVSGSSTSAITTVPRTLAASTGTARLRILSSKKAVSITISVFIRRTIDVAAGTTSNS
jgi:hypothetical protein